MSAKFRNLSLNLPLSQLSLFFLLFLSPENYSSRIQDEEERERESFDPLQSGRSNLETQTRALART